MPARNHEPGIFRHHMRDQKINLRRSIGHRSAAGMAVWRKMVRTPAQLARRLHLEPPKPLIPIQNEVVSVTVSVGLRHPKNEARRLLYKSQLTQLTPSLGAASARIR